MTKLKIKDQIHLSKRLGFLISANIPLSESLRMLKNSSRSEKEKKLLELIINDISLGRSLATAFEKSQAFNRFGIYLAEVGETSGSLGQNLSQLSLELEAKQNLRQKMISALIYPFFISIAALGMSIMLITFVFPQVLPILSGLNGELPLPTRMLIFLSTNVRHFGLYILTAAAGGGGLFLFSLKRFPKFRFRWESLELRLPYFNQFIINYQLANFSRTLGLLLENGFVLENSLNLITRHSSNVVYQRAYQELRKQTVEGQTLASSMKDAPIIFPPLFKEMIEVGEASGKLSEALIYLSRLYQTEIEERIKALSGMIEPALMIFMGFVIGGVALSIILPIYQITNNLHH